VGHKTAHRNLKNKFILIKYSQMQQQQPQQHTQKKKEKKKTEIEPIIQG
jgi:hypothetical protein